MHRFVALDLLLSSKYDILGDLEKLYTHGGHSVKYNFHYLLSTNLVSTEYVRCYKLVYYCMRVRGASPSPAAAEFVWCLVTVSRIYLPRAVRMRLVL